MNKKILTSGKAVIQQESKALTQLADLLDENFIAAAELILELKNNGHVIVSGMGKAGLIGSKISATFSSIGVPSFCLHPAEALHGDLGRFTKKDLALILSNSGETDEIVQMIQAIKKIGSPIIAITNSLDNTLAKHATVTIVIGKQEEAGKLGLAPTSSTIKMLAVGDALAMAILEERDLSPQDFAFYHPAGNLGRMLIKTSEIMRQGENLCVVNESDIVSDVIKSYSSTKGRPGAAIIVNNQGLLVGVFTDGDLRRLLDNDLELLKQSISKVMSSNPKVVALDTLAVEASRILTSNKIDQVIVVDEENRPVGLIDIQDVISLNNS